MKTARPRLVDLREGEGVPLVQASFVLFGIIAGHTMLETVRDALFLTRLPANRLPIVYVLLAGLTLLGNMANARLVPALGRKNTLVFTLLVAACGTTVIHFHLDSPGIIYVLYLSSALLGTIMAIQFWMFAVQRFTLAQGKRLFGPIASGGVLGAVFGASFAALALRFITVPYLLLASAGLFLATAVLLTRIRAEAHAPMRVDVEAAAKDGGPERLATIFRDEPYLLRVAALVALSTAALLTTDYIFKATVASMAGGRDLGQVLGTYYAVLNGVALVVQVGFAPRLLRSQGVIVASTVLPALLLLGAVGILVGGGRGLLVFALRGSDGALRHSLHRVANELLWMPVSATIRDRAKAFVDGVMARGTQAVSAAVILALSVLGWDAPRVLAGGVLVLVVAWIATAISLREPYLELIRRAIRGGMLDDPSMMQDLDLGAVEAVLESLSSRDTTHVLAAMDLLVAKGRARLIPALILYHDQEVVLIRALEILSMDPGRTDWIPIADRLLSHGTEAVRVAVVRALATTRNPEHVARARLDPSPAVRAHAAFSRAHGDHADTPRKDPVILELLALDGAEGRSARIALLDAIRDKQDARFADLVLETSTSDDPEILEHAAAAMAALKDVRFIPVLIERLGMRDGRNNVHAALAKLGEPALDALERVLLDTTVSPRVRFHVPRTLSHFHTQRAVDVLLARLSTEPSGGVRYKILRALERLAADTKLRFDRAPIEEEIRRNLIEHLRTTALRIPLEAGRATLPKTSLGGAELLIGLLEDKARQARERAFRLLQVAHRHEDIRSVELALSSDDRRVRANAQEFIEVVTASHDRKLEEDNREMWRVIADDLPPSERVARAARFLPAMPETYGAVLALLVEEHDEYLASLAGYHALEVGSDDLRDRVIEAYEARPSLRALLAEVTALPRLVNERTHG